MVLDVRLTSGLQSRRICCSLCGVVEVDEICFGGKRSNMSNARRKAREGTGRGSVGKTAVVGIKDRETNAVRATVADGTDARTLHPFINPNLLNRGSSARRSCFESGPSGQSVTIPTPRCPNPGPQRAEKPLFKD